MDGNNMKNKRGGNMKRFKIVIGKNGVAIWDRINKFYVLDASTIQEDLSFTIHKPGVKRRKGYKWELKIEYKIKDIGERNIK